MMPRRTALVLLVFAVVLAAGFAALSRFSALYDADSYAHLAIARHYRAAGVHAGLPWARFSAFREGFGDKEFLFHVVLMPFVGTTSSATGGRLVLALLDAGIAAALAGLAMRAAGPWGALLPFLLFLGSLDVASRALRLRPELLSLLLLLAAAQAAAAGRDRRLGVLGTLYALSYTAVHAFAGLAVGWWLYEGLVRSRWLVRRLAWPLLGVALGLALHPQFPHNLAVFWLQNVVQPLATNGATDVGGEFTALVLRDAVHYNATALLLLGLLAWRLRRARPESDNEPPDHGPYTVAAACFGVLYAVGLPRFGLYFYPFAALALLTASAGRIRLPRPRASVLTIAVLAIGLAWPAQRALLKSLDAGMCFVPDREEQWRRFGAAVPAGARVAATWGEAEWYVFWAPQGRYLNLFDPVFMAAHDPRAYFVQREIFEGREPDIPLALLANLDSDHLAFTRLVPERRFCTRLRRDPRIRPVFEGHDAVFAVVPHANGDFVLDWMVAAASSRVPRVAEDLADWTHYPRQDDPTLAAVEGFIDVRRLGVRDDCRRFAHVERLTNETRLEWELAAQGPSTVWVDGRAVLTLQRGAQAVLGEGVLLPLALGRGQHVLTIDTCPEEGRSGFYFVERKRTDAPHVSTGMPR